jgi:sterol-4alpha-carboxylate 3-dehydrogenase (decarboxylating)
MHLFRLGYTVEKMPTSWFHLSEDMSNQIALSVASSLNFAVNALKSLAEGNNWELFFKVYTPLQNFVDSQSYIF